MDNFEENKHSILQDNHLSVQHILAKPDLSHDSKFFSERFWGLNRLLVLLDVKTCTLKRRAVVVLGTNSMRQALLEVERKFCGLAVPQLKANAGTPNFLSLQYLGEQIFDDTYYDKHNKLSSSGVWVRKRQWVGKEPVWEAKVRTGGTFNNSMFEEFTDTKAIARYVTNVTGQEQAASKDFGLDIMAHLGTQRKSWLADNRFKIVLDLTDFGHQVGEVELEHKLTLPLNQGPDFDVEAWKRSISQDMDNQVDWFMNHYRWAFQSGTPRGKLTAFFERQQRYKYS